MVAKATLLGIEKQEKILQFCAATSKYLIHVLDSFFIGGFMKVHNKMLFATVILVVALGLSLYAQAPLSTNMAASGVLGTTNFVTNTNYAPPSTTTLAEPTGVAIDPTTGKLFVADRDGRRVLRFSSAAKMIDGSAAEAVLGQPDFVTRTRNTGGISAATTNDPNAVCVDGNGRLWVADMTNNRVLRFDNASTIASVSSANGVLGQPDFVTNSAGITASKMNTPTSVYVDGNGTLWVADRANNRVLRFANAAAKANGAAADGVLGQADFVTATTGLTASTMNTPWGVHVDFGGRLWVADRVNNRVLRFDNASAKSNGGSADGVLGEPDFTTSVYNTTQGGLGEPRGVAVDGLGRLYVADEGNTRVMIYNNAAGLANGANADNVLGQPDFTTAASATSATGLSYPLSIFIENQNNSIWIPDVYNHRILRYAVNNVTFSTSMAASGVLGQAGFITNTSGVSSSTLDGPKGIAIDPTTGKLFVADYNNRRVLRWSSVDKMTNGSAAEAVFGQLDFNSNVDYSATAISASTLVRPYCLYVDAAGRLWVADFGSHRVLRFDGASSKASNAPADRVLGQPDFVTGTANTGGITASSMNRPLGIYGDASGNLYVSERDNRRVLRFNNAAAKGNGASADAVLGQPDFATTTLGLTDSKLGNRAWGVFADAGGRLWVADRDNHRVLRFDNAASKTSGAAADAVLGQADFTSNAIALTASGLSDPKGVFMDGLGRLYVCDEGNNRIKVYNNAATLSFAANADNVLGQPDFVTSTAPNPPTSSSLAYAEFVAIENSSNHIWATEQSNHRVLRYDVSPLPVELVSFTATVVAGKVALNWATATEMNNAGFAVEKNTNNVWNKIGYVEGNGTSNAPHQYTFSDNASAGKYQYRLKQIDRDGKFEYSNVVEATVAMTAADYKLGQNYPNPFNPTTTITFALKNTERATVTVYNTLGQEVATLFNGIATANEVYSLLFNAKNLASGIYFYTLRSASRNEILKMSLMK